MRNGRTGALLGVGLGGHRLEADDAEGVLVVEYHWPVMDTGLCQAYVKRFTPN